MFAAWRIPVDQCFRTPGYVCCTFRGSIHALDARTSNSSFQTFTIHEAVETQRVLSWVVNALIVCTDFFERHERPEALPFFRGSLMFVESQIAASETPKSTPGYRQSGRSQGQKQQESRNFDESRHYMSFAFKTVPLSGV